MTEWERQNETKNPPPPHTHTQTQKNVHMYDSSAVSIHINILVRTYIFRGTVVILVSRFYMNGELRNKRTLQKKRKKKEKKDDIITRKNDCLFITISWPEWTQEKLNVIYFFWFNQDDFFPSHSPPLIPPPHLGGEREEDSNNVCSIFTSQKSPKCMNQDVRTCMLQHQFMTEASLRFFLLVIHRTHWPKL